MSPSGIVVGDILQDSKVSPVATVAVVYSISVYIINGDFCLFIDILVTPVWASLKQLQDPELSELAAVLPLTVMNARADSTTKKYIYAFNRWKQWAASKDELVVFPVDPYHLALYLQYVADTTQSKSAVEEAVSAASWAHQVAGLTSLREDSIVKMTLAGLQRMLVRPIVACFSGHVAGNG